MFTEINMAYSSEKKAIHAPIWAPHARDPLL